MTEHSDALELMPATRQLELIRDGVIGVVELAEAHLGQITRLNPALNAFADFDAGRVLARARELDASTGDRGPLHGLPVTVKSSIAAAGYRCEIGSTLLRGDVPTEDAVVVERLRRAGALVLGTTNCPEFLMAYETDNLLYGRTSNPWGLDYSPGGSSGGEAAAIAAGMSAAGLGSDSGGSVRLPAHFTGICALKPTPGRIPGRGHLPPCVGPFGVLGAIGPIARTVGDLRMMFDVLGGQDRDDPLSRRVIGREVLLEELRAITVGYFEDDGLVPVTGETRRAVQDSVRALREAGLRVEPFRPNALEGLRRLWWVFFVQCGAMFYEPTIRGRRGELSPIFREFLAIAEAQGELTSMSLLQAWADLDLLRGAMLEEMREYPVLLCPVASIPAFRHGERGWVVEGQRVEYLDAVRHTQWFNVLAAPAVVVPVGRSTTGLPIGVQVVARPDEDELALAVAAVLDEEFGYQAPPMAIRG